MKDIYVTRPSLPDYDDYIAEIKSIWETKHITNFGEKYQKLKEKLEQKFAYKYIDLQVNGHMTLQNILSCIEPGEIITTSFSFVSTSLAILNSGHVPVFCDIDPETFNIDVSKIESLITKNTVAIVPVHVFGVPCDIEGIATIANKYGLKVVYDAAHAFGVKVGDKNIGAFGDASMFSFHATKVFNTIEGGMGVFKDIEWRDECVCRSNFGIYEAQTVYQGVNSKMNEFQAAMGLVNLDQLEKCFELRKQVSDYYDEQFKDIKNIYFQSRRSISQYNYAYYPIVLKTFNVEAFLDECSKHNVYPRRYFYPAINDMPLFNKYNQKTPVARYVSDRIVCLPIFAGMTDEEMKKVADVVKGVLIDEK